MFGSATGVVKVTVLQAVTTARGKSGHVLVRTVGLKNPVISITRIGYVRSSEVSPAKAGRYSTYPLSPVPAIRPFSTGVGGSMAQTPGLDI
jgi:hypothetical protein